MNVTRQALEAEFLLPTAATRLGFLSRRDNGNTALNTVRDDGENGWASSRDTSLDTYEALELLALGEVVSRKAHDSQLRGIRAARRRELGADRRGPRPPDFAWDSFNEGIAERLDADWAVSRILDRSSG